ncbi:hypothetical protein Drorol1_Dr00025196 [Drosera rotundifolia]
MVDFGSKPLGSGHVSYGSKAGSAANVNSSSKNGWAGSGDFDYGDFQNARVSSNVSSSGSDKHTSSSSASAFPMENFSSKSQLPVQSSGADSFDMLFPSSLVSSEAAKAGSGASISQPFSDIGEDWGLESEFGGGDQDVGGTIELHGLPLPPAEVSASTAKNKGIDNQKQGQYADAIKWLLWAEVLREKAGDVNGTMESLDNKSFLLQGRWSDPVKELLADVETKSKKLEVESKRQKTALSDSISCRSSITNSEGTSDAVYPHRLQVPATATARCHVMKLKVAKERAERRATTKLMFDLG